LVTKAIKGLLLCFFVSLLTFRLLSPHAFAGALPSVLGFFDLRPYGPFFSQIREAQYQTSGLFDIPPNYQWVNRPQYIFAWRNIVLWGLGLPLGLIAWGGFFVALVQIIRGRREWTRVVLPTVWVLVYFALIGKNWVATMRYFIVLYPALAMIGAWFLVAQVRWASAAYRRHRTPIRRFVQFSAAAILIFVTAFTALWATGFTAIYKRQLTRVEASQWVLRNLPSAAAANVRMDTGESVLFNFPWGGVATSDTANVLQIQRKALVSGQAESFTLPHVVDKESPAGTKSTLRIRLLRTTSQSKPIAEASIEADFTQAKTSRFGDAYTVKLDQPVAITAGEQYWMEVTSSGPALQLTGTVIATEGPWDDPLPWKVCPLPASVPLTHDTPSGLSSSTCEGVDGFGENLYKGYELYMVAEDNDQKRNTILTGMNDADYITISSNRFYDTLPRNPARFPMTTKFYKELFAGKLGYDVMKTVTSWIQIGPITIPDQVLPTDSLPAWMNEWESEEAFSVYDHPAVFILKKQPGYTDAAVKAVLYGTNTNDQNAIQPGLYESPTVVGKVNWASFDASRAPTAFMLTPEQLRIQQAGGTWSELFNRNSPLNTTPLGVVAFYLTILVFGWVTFPLMATILPGLPDKGYPLAKFAGLLIVSWVVWVGGTLNFLTWTPGGILLTLVALTVVSVILFLRNRQPMLTFVRTRFRYILIVEGITLALFIAFLLVRLGNPDLWAQSLGGEKPMDFSYWNAVLRSTIFPPYDPWYSGGYLNYYYFGYVIVGTPVKLLGIMPQIAYNMVVPMLFAVTGIGAFSVAYNLVASRTSYPQDDGNSDPNAPAEARRRWALRVPSGSPLVAGVAAMLLCVVLGNLDTPRVMLNGIARAGGYQDTANADAYSLLLDDFLRQNGRSPTANENDQLLAKAQSMSAADSLQLNLANAARFVNSIGTGLSTVANLGYIPVGPDRWFWGPSRVLGELPNNSSEITEFPSFTFIYADLHAHMISMPLQLLALSWLLAEILAAGRIRRRRFAAAGATIFGGLVVGVLFPTNTWDWITYMILAVAGLTFAAWLRAAATRGRSTEPGPAVQRGMFKAFGVLDWPPLRFLQTLFFRRAVIEWLALLVGFFIAQQVAGEPFRTYFATGYSSVSPFLGNKSPLWAFVDIHGLFLFLMASFLIWQTARVLRRTYVRDLLRERANVLMLVIALLLIVLVTLAFTILNLRQNIFIFDPPYPAAWVIFPMMGWAAILFFLPNQSREVRALLAVLILALALTLGAEMVTLANDSGRQNTIFKLYMQVWILFACIGGVALSWLVRASERWHGGLRSMWLALTVLLFAIAGMFPVMATQGKIAMRMAPQAPHTLDGLEYMNYAVYGFGDNAIPLKGDLAIITWLQDNVQGSPVILEAQLPEYQLGNRIAWNTGLPAVLGWRYHQTQQRSLEPMGNLIWARLGNVATMYNTTDLDLTHQLLRFYNVEYIIVGGLERAYYKPEGLLKFSAMAKTRDLELVYENGSDRIYRVTPQAKKFDTSQLAIGDTVISQ
jgi:YYY domain-containing protein